MVRYALKVMPSGTRTSPPARLMAAGVSARAGGRGQCGHFRYTAFSAYTSDAIKLTPDFFNSLKEASRVTLT
ncbi:hypothetical protein OHT68_46690 [Streptomyces canus]|uniref:hypothetical protein n=1 Tax=Streptomyces canus TaxID=58343 RepID=UPI002E2C7A3E|nr:hypothetical protein [Streptomyces canus]